MPFLTKDIISNTSSGKVYGKKGEEVTVINDERYPTLTVKGSGDPFFTHKDNLKDYHNPEKEASKEVSRLPAVLSSPKPKIKKVTKNDIPKQTKMF